MSDWHRRHERAALVRRWFFDQIPSISTTLDVGEDATCRLDDKAQREKLEDALHDTLMELTHTSVEGLELKSKIVQIVDDWYSEALKGLEVEWTADTAEAKLDRHDALDLVDELFPDEQPGAPAPRELAVSFSLGRMAETFTCVPNVTRAESREVAARPAGAPLPERDRPASSSVLARLRAASKSRR